MRAFMLATAAPRAPAQDRPFQDRQGITALNPPPRATVAVARLPRDVRVEISAIAVR